MTDCRLKLQIEKRGARGPGSGLARQIFEAPGVGQWGKGIVLAVDAKEVGTPLPWVETADCKHTVFAWDVPVNNHHDKAEPRCMAEP